MKNKLYQKDGNSGRDPRTIPAEEWKELGFKRMSAMKAIRAKCLDCAHTQSEVRYCVVFSCPLWPYRMGSTPKGLKVAEKEDALESEE